MPFAGIRKPEPALLQDHWKRIFATVEKCNTGPSLARREKTSLQLLFRASARLAKARAGTTPNYAAEEKALLDAKLHTEIIKLAREKHARLLLETSARERARQFSRRG